MRDLERIPLRTVIAKEGQAYVDEAVYVHPLPVGSVERAVRAMIQEETYPQPGPVPRQMNLPDACSPMPRSLLTSYNHVRLKWMKQGKNGKLVPR